MKFLNYFFDIWKERKATTFFVIFMMILLAVVETLKIIFVVPLLKYFIEPGEAFTAGSGEESGLIAFVVNQLSNFCSFLGVPLNLFTLLLFIIGIFFLTGIVSAAQQHVMNKEFINYMYALTKRLFSSYFSAPWSFFIKNKPGGLVNLLTAEVERAGQAYCNMCLTISSLIVVILHIALSMFASWELTLFAFLILPLFFVILRQFMKLAMKYGEKDTIMNTKLKEEFTEDILAAKMIKASSRENIFIDSVQRTVKQQQHFYYLSRMNKVIMKSLQEPMGMCLLALIIIISVNWLRLDPSITLLILVIFLRIGPRFYVMQRHYQVTLSFMPAAEAIMNKMAYADSIAEVSGKVPFEQFKAEIVFDHVYFSYDKEINVLDDVSLVVKRGERVGIIGMSGSGKSTIADLIVGLIHPDVGQVMVDGIPVKDYAIPFWRSSVGYVTQEMHLFHDSVRFNLTLGNPDIKDEDIIHAMKLGHAYEFVSKMKEGLDTIIGDRGFRLSGGQRQRLALSRTILANPQIYIFDEATSALDSESENKIRDAINTLAQKSTIIIIAHRISTLRNVDRIYVMDQGKVIESGTWEQLMKQEGNFKQLMALQKI